VVVADARFALALLPDRRSEPQQSTPPNAQPVAQAAPTAESTAAQQSARLNRLWQGNLDSVDAVQPDIGRCNAVVESRSLFQQASTRRPLHLHDRQQGLPRPNTTFTIADGQSAMAPSALRVMLPDGSSCLFNGRPSNNTRTGSYF